MDLHPLHRPTDLSKARTAPDHHELAAHWEQECRTMQAIASEKAQKVEKLKTQLAESEQAATSWRERYNQLLAATVSSKKENEALAAQLQPVLAQGQRDRAEVEQLRAQKQGVQKELDRLRASQLARDKELDQLRASKQAVQKELDQLRTNHPRLRAVEQELASAHAKLRTAADDVSARDMLARAQQVLQTCSDLHSERGGPSSVLADALRETTASIGEFLRKRERFF